MKIKQSDKISPRSDTGQVLSLLTPGPGGDHPQMNTSASWTRCFFFLGLRPTFLQRTASPWRHQYTSSPTLAKNGVCTHGQLQFNTQVDRLDQILAIYPTDQPTRLDRLTPSQHPLLHPSVIDILCPNFCSGGQTMGDHSLHGYIRGDRVMSGQWPAIVCVKTARNNRTLWNQVG